MKIGIRKCIRQTYSAWRAALKPDWGSFFPRGFQATLQTATIQDAFPRDGKDGKGTIIQTETFSRIPVIPILPMFAGMH